MEGKNLKNIPGEGHPVEVTLDLGALREAVETLQKEIEEDLEFSEDDLAEILSGDEEVVEEDGAASDAYVQANGADDDDAEGAASGVKTSAQAEEERN
jgi:hypothetical protein